MSLHHLEHALGHTRSRRAADHLLHTPDSFVFAPLPGMANAAAAVHASPQLGAGFVQYTGVLQAGGTIAPTTLSRFVYVLEGSVSLHTNAATTLHQAGDYLYLPPGHAATFSSAAGARVTVIQKTYEPLASMGTPAPFAGREADIPGVALLDDEAVQVRALLPANPAYDFAVNTMTYQPGARLSMVEVHVMEHGLLMLEGEGIYRLGDHWYPVNAGDFIWMAPYCPQWFGALGPVPAKYLIYKDWNRHPMRGGE